MRCAVILCKKSVKSCNVNVVQSLALKKILIRSAEEILFLKALYVSAIRDGVKRGQMQFIHSFIPFFHQHPPPAAGDTVLHRAPKSLGSALLVTIDLLRNRQYKHARASSRHPTEWRCRKLPSVLSICFFLNPLTHPSFYSVSSKWSIVEFNVLF